MNQDLVVRAPPSRSNKLGRLWERLQCPHTRGPVAIIPTLIATGDVMEGVIYSVERRDVVGMISNFKPNFVSFSRPDNLPEILDDYRQEREPVTAAEERVWRVHETTSSLLKFEGGWQEIEYGWMMAGSKAGDEILRFETSDPFEVMFIAHPHSGYAEVAIDGNPYACCDLFNPLAGVPHYVRYTEPMNGPVTVEIRRTKQRNPKSRGSQVIVEEVRILSREIDEPRFSPKARSRSNDFKQRAYEIMASLPEDAAILDLGGGRRMADDDRYINTDIEPYGETDMVADAHHLPLKDGSIDFVYSDAVFEHLIEPKIAAQEVYRVLSDDGRALVLTAFMQPVHSEGYHFYNATQWGADNWFRHFPYRRIGHGGLLSYTFAWMARVSGAKAGLGSKDWAEFERISKRMDELVTPERLGFVASFIRIEASKIPL